MCVDAFNRNAYSSTSLFWLWFSQPCTAVFAKPITNSIGGISISNTIIDVVSPPSSLSSPSMFAISSRNDNLKAIEIKYVLLNG